MIEVSRMLVSFQSIDDYLLVMLHLILKRFKRNTLSLLPHILVSDLEHNNCFVLYFCLMMSFLFTIFQMLPNLHVASFGTVLSQGMNSKKKHEVGKLSVWWSKCTSLSFLFILVILGSACLSFLNCEKAFSSFVYRVTFPFYSSRFILNKLTCTETGGNPGCSCKCYSACCWCSDHYWCWLWTGIKSMTHVEWVWYMLTSLLPRHLMLIMFEILIYHASCSSHLFSFYHILK